MEFEILNTVRFLVFMVLVGAVFWYIKRKVKKKVGVFLQWKYYFLVVMGLTLLTNTQFYTLTEKEAVKGTVNIMLQQKDNFNSREVHTYLENTQPERLLDRSNLEKELLLEQEKSKQLANQIDNK